MEKRTVDVIVISDVHLGTYGCRAKDLSLYLKSVSPNILILNGDIIDGWQFSKHYFPASHMDVVKEILNLMSSGTRVFYITGNHDELLRRYSDFQTNNFTLTDKLVIEIDNKMTWIFHGDVFDNTTKGIAKIFSRLGSTGYACLIVFNRLINQFLNILGKERVSISKLIMASVNKTIVRIKKFEMTVAELAISKKYDYVICGHIHQPQKKIIETEEGIVTYLNPGDWLEHRTSLEYNQKEWTIFSFDENNFSTETGVSSRDPVNVMTDEVSFHINSLAM